MAETGEVEHEARDVSFRLLAWLALGLALFVVAVVAATRLAFPATDADRDRGPHRVQAGIGLQTDARGDLLADRRRHARDVAAIDDQMRRQATAARP